MEIGVDASSRLATGNHGGNDQVRTGDIVSAGENAWAGSCHGFAIDNDQAVFMGLEVWRGLANDRIGPVAERQYGGIGIDDEIRVFNGHWLAATFSIWLAELHADALDLFQRAVFTSDEFDRLGEELVLGALFAGELAVFAPAGHLFLGAAVEAGNFIGTHAQSGAQAVGGSVAAADDGYLAPDGRAGTQICRQHIQGYVGADQELGSFVDTWQVFAGHFHGSIDLGAYANKDSFVSFIKKIINRLVFADIGVSYKLHTGRRQVLPAGEDHVFGQLEVGDAIEQQAARLGFAIRK